ncbi:MAG: VOC family protein [Actinomycetota bacterium]
MTASTIARPFPSGSRLDHIAWAVPDTRVGVADMVDRTGAQIKLYDEPEAGQFYHSAALRFADGQFLEILGPAPGVTGHPLTEYLRALPEGRLLFWYIRVDDWNRLEQAATSLDRPLSWVESVDDPRYHAYRRAGIGKDFDPAVPNAIRWDRRHVASDEDGVCRLAGFEVGHPDTGRLQRIHDELGTELVVAAADVPTLALEFDAPNGRIRLEGIGNPMAGTDG